MISSAFSERTSLSDTIVQASSLAIQWSRLYQTMIATVAIRLPSGETLRITTLAGCLNMNPFFASKSQTLDVLSSLEVTTRLLSRENSDRINIPKAVHDRRDSGLPLFSRPDILRYSQCPCIVPIGGSNIFSIR